MSIKGRISIPGAAGKMGRMLIRALADHPTFMLGAASEHAGHAALGQDVGVLAGLPKLGVLLNEGLALGLDDAHAVIDFTAPAATLELLAHLASRARPVPVVIGTTGFDDAQKRAIAEHARTLPIVLSANMSLGVNLLAVLCEQAARALGSTYDIEVLELHHRLKKDSPSGTALLLGDALAKGRGLSLADHAIHGRSGLVGARPTNEIGLHAVRGGDVIGEHTAYFFGIGERIELTHKASSRETFANGALVAARWLIAQQKPPGLYSMKDVLGL